MAGATDFKPALRFDALTSLFDPLIATFGREQTFKRRVLAEAALQSGETVLDIGCGTGTLALMAHEARLGAEVVGLDADPAILDRARSKAAAAGAAIGFDEGFSNELPYPDGRFDVVMSTLFFHHLEDAEKRATATEIQRVLKPGGRLVVGDVGRPQDPVMRLVALSTVQLLDGFATTSLNVGGGLPTLFAAAGFEDVAVVDRLRTPVGSLEVLAGRRGPA